MGERKRVIALGFFDGIHIGHAALLERTVQRAREIAATPSVLSFDIHPDTLVFGKEVPLINSAAGRADLIRRLFGIENVIFIHFDRSVMQMPWQEFVQTLIQEMDAAWVVVGHDFRFGWKGEGTAQRLKEYCSDLGIGCDIIPAVTMEGRVVSSTYIRELIEAGEMERANAFLGHPHTLVDTVHYGYRLGTKMGTPTINMRFPDGVLVPRYGVYAARAVLDDGSEHMAVTNVGVRPTVSGEDRVSVESFILDYSGNLYDRQVRIEFFRFIRPEMKFPSVDALKAQILKDAETTRAYFESEDGNK
jgi:riboflavin kinase/FMN adenylyltransferase